MSDLPPAPQEPIFIALPSTDLKAAFRKASDTLPDFISHLAVGDGRWCSAKLCFKDPEWTDETGTDQLLYCWLAFATYDPERRMFTAEFTELPECLQPYHHIGQRLGFEGEDIFDWMVLLEGSLFGGFTMRVARQGMSGMELTEYDSYVGVSEYLDRTHP